MKEQRAKQNLVKSLEEKSTVAPVACEKSSWSDIIETRILFDVLFLRNESERIIKFF